MITKTSENLQIFEEDFSQIFFFSFKNLLPNLLLPLGDRIELNLFVEYSWFSNLIKLLLFFISKIATKLHTIYLIFVLFISKQVTISETCTQISFSLNDLNSADLIDLYGLLLDVFCLLEIDWSKSPISRKEPFLTFVWSYLNRILKLFGRKIRFECILCKWT